MDDREIVGLYWQRSERAIDETARKYGSYCRIIAYNILENPQDSDECVNDTWLGAWNSMPDKKPERLGPFLGKITRNFALKKIRRGMAQKRGGGEALLALEELDECIPSGYCLEREVEDRELSRALDRFLDTLPEREQAAFVGRYWFMAGERELAKKLGMSRSGISAMLKRTRKKLRTFLMMEGLCTIQNEF